MSLLCLNACDAYSIRRLLSFLLTCVRFDAVNEFHCQWSGRLSTNCDRRTIPDKHCLCLIGCSMDRLWYFPYNDECNSGSLDTMHRRKSWELRKHRVRVGVDQTIITEALCDESY